MEKFSRGKFGKLTLFKHSAKEVRQISRSADRLLIESSNWDGFSLANHGQFAKFAKLLPPPNFPATRYNICTEPILYPSVVSVSHSRIRRSSVPTSVCIGDEV